MPEPATDDVVHAVAGPALSAILVADARATPRWRIPGEGANDGCLFHLRAYPDAHGDRSGHEDGPGHDGKATGPERPLPGVA